MMSSSVTPRIEEEGADVDGAEGVEGVVVPDHLDRNCALFCLIVVWSMAHIMEKWSNEGKRT